MALVTSITLGGAPNDERRIEVRSARYASAASDFGRAYVTRADDSGVSVSADIVFSRLRKGLLLESCSGIVPSAGSVEIALISSILLMLVSRLSSTNASPIPQARPSRRPTWRFRGTLGVIGCVGVRAISTTRILLDRRPALTPASFSRCRRSWYSCRFDSASRFSTEYSIALSLSWLASCFCWLNAVVSKFSVELRPNTHRGPHAALSFLRLRFPYAPV